MLAARPRAALVLLLGCACTEAVDFVEAPFLGPAYLVTERRGLPVDLRPVVLGEPLRLTQGADERLFVIAPELEVVRRLHPELRLESEDELELYWSELAAPTCPYGEAPRPGVRGHALPAAAWRLEELSGSSFGPPRSPPAWLARLRLRAPVAPACGLPAPRFTRQALPLTGGPGISQLERVDERRWIVRSPTRDLVSLVELEPPRVAATLRPEDLGIPAELEPLRDLQVDTSTHPPVLILATLQGLVRATIHADRFELRSHEGRAQRLLDLEPHPAGGLVGVGEDGVVFRLAALDAEFEPRRVLPGVGLELITYAGAPDWRFVLGAEKGGLYFGDPVVNPQGLASGSTGNRSWRSLSAVRDGAPVEVFGLDSGSTLVRVDGPGRLVPVPQLLPPEVTGCDTPAPDACGFISPTRIKGEALVATRQAGLGGTFLILMLERCRAVVVLRPEPGCGGAFEPLDPEVTDPIVELTGLSEKPEGVYLGDDAGRLWRWDRGP